MVKKKTADDEEQKSPLHAMNPEERMVADYAGMGVTVGRHPMAHCREQLRSMNVCRADDLRMLRHGVKARIASCVIARQRPGTAHGFIFLSIEDETGISNAIIAQSYTSGTVHSSRMPAFCWSKGRCKTSIRSSTSEPGTSKS